jgi:5S rRNA maturation endonuclease (ribonuclease M5)
MFNGIVTYSVIKSIYNNEEEVFRHFFSLSPQSGIRFKSPFRTDEHAGCRFSRFRNKWWIIDNAQHNGKLVFDCIDAVETLMGVDRAEAIEIIQSEVELKKRIRDTSIPFEFKLRYDNKEWTDNNYFTKELNLPVNYLTDENVERVNNYYCNTRDNRRIRINPIHNSQNTDTYAYNLNGRIELYFPGSDPKSIKTTLITDYYGDTTPNELWLVEGNKDRMVLNYHFKLNAVGLQTTTSKLDERFNNKKLHVWLDPDNAGIECSKRIKEQFPQANIITNVNMEGDISFLYKHNYNEINSCVNRYKSN